MEMRKGFTLIELVVAVAILAMVISFSTVVFKVSIKAQRIASANMEIMQKMRAITDQLNADWKGYIANTPGKILFQRHAESYEDNKVYYTGEEDVNDNIGSDSILFFASGDFQSTGQYEYAGGDEKTVIGTAACIYYGLADVASYSETEEYDPKKKVLVRRQIILTPDTNWPELEEDDEWGEYYRESLTDFLVNLDMNDVNSENGLMEKVVLALEDANDLAMYMAKGVDDFTIQYVGEERDEEGNSKDKEFNEWRPTDEEVEGWPEYLEPVALKFSFTIYDSRAIIEKGRRFTHIVYLGD
jgi:prepilin-type N-terminal cleavage/methylation domain-containing protein